MGHKVKVGKQRKDKFYRLAKETGFRSRAAFKLLQLNRKFGFLEKSRVLLDLCAAPGGWMQVAKQNMPVSSLIVGVDLFPIKPIPGCISLVEDITTSKCKVAIGKALQTWKADIVLNDGAPNVGTNWLFDAYQQACLTLSALKLATEFLREGGWFITKIFRSKDYNSLLWVFKQLFNKVQATKPQASRNESAEIFVICQYYKAPDKLDPKFLQPQYVFKELELDSTNKLNIFHPDKQKKAKPEGYMEGDYTLFNSVKATDFINSENAIEILQKASEIVFDDNEILTHPKTTNEIKECCKDIKVLNRKDVRSLLAWWKVIKESLTKKEEEKTITTKENEPRKDEELSLTDEDEKELDEIDQRILDLKKEEQREMKKKKKTADKERRKLQEKMKLKMIMERHDDPGLAEETKIFRLGLIKSGEDLNQVLEQKPEILAESDAESDENALPKPKKVTFNTEKSFLDISGKYYKEEESEEEFEEENESIDGEGLGFINNDSDDEDIVISKMNEKNENPLLTDLDYRAKKEKKLSKVALWFEKETLKDLETEADEDYDLDILSQDLKKKGKVIVGEEDNTEMSNGTVKKKRKKKQHEDDSDSNSESDSNSDSDYDVNEVTDNAISRKKAKANDFEVVPQKQNKRKLNEEGLAIGALMVTSKKKKRDLIDGAWNRYAFNDENLPDWFVQDEKENMSQNIPVPENMVKEYKNKMKEINVRPIKKIVEAKARKKRRMLKSLQKAKKKVEDIIDNVDISEREKVRNIQKLYKKAKATQKKEVTYVVARKSNTGKKIKRPKGVKGRYKVVDPRMKKDTRRLKNKAKEMKKRRKSKK